MIVRRPAITRFKITSSGAAITAEAWAAREPQAVWYGLPIEGTYEHPEGGEYRRCRVEAFNGAGELLGYLPLPHRYANAWSQLCYSIVYWVSMWKAWAAEAGRPRRNRSQPTDLVKTCINNSATRFLKYLLIRRLIIDELLEHPMSKREDDQLDIFDEFIIRDRFDWLWTGIADIPQSQRDYLELDPVHPSNQVILGKSRFRHQSLRLTRHGADWKNPKLAVPEQMIVPTPSPSHTWIWGEINHFDFDKYFNEQFPAVCEFFRNKAYESQLDLPYDKIAKVPARWHEGHRPAVRFLTEEGDRFFMHPQ